MKKVGDTLEPKYIKGYGENYLIFSSGPIKSLHFKNRNKIIVPRIDRAGYYTVRLSQNGNTKTKYLHRLLAEHFIPNPNGKKYVNHINGNKLDNSLCNLEWSTHSENILHAYTTGLIKNKGKLVEDTISGRMYVSIKEASEIVGINHNTLKNYLNGCIKFNPTSLQFHKSQRN